MAKQRVITLLTDFGWAGPYVSEMKGVILSMLPQVALVDITHNISPGDVLAGAFVLRQVVPHFPPGTVHCVVVDPGVGTQRRILAGRYAAQVVLFPDNGVISLVNEGLPLEEIVVVGDERYFLGEGTLSTFQGRDVIAPVAARVCAGLPLRALGASPQTFKVLELPKPRVDEDGALVGEVLYVDDFGNLISNIPARLLGESFGQLLDLEVSCNGRRVGAVQPAYGFVAPGLPLALINSMNMLEVAVNRGRACDEFQTGSGAKVRVRRPPPDGQVLPPAPEAGDAARAGGDPGAV